MLAQDLRPELRWLSAGFLLVFCSAFGQTYFIAIFAGDIKAALSLTDGAFGTIYMAGTLASAALLVWGGRLADRLPVRWLGAGTLAGLALAAVGMASVTSTWMLAVAVFGLRFFGQGMLTTVAMTAMARWFVRRRGRAISIAALGFPAAEAALAIAAVAAVGFVGWRATWLLIAALLVAVAAPALIALLRHGERTPPALPAASPAASPAAPAAPASPVPVSPAPGFPTASPADARRDWTRGEMLRSPLFYALLPGLLAMPLVFTGVFFNQVAVVELKGWELAWFAAAFPVLAGANVLSALAAGWLIDRIGARRLLPVSLVPQGLSILLLVFAGGVWVLPVFMALAGVAVGLAATVQGALLAELYGTRHLGAIRAAVVAAMVFATALAPAVIGLLLDAGVPLAAQLGAMAVFCFAAAAWTAALIPRLDRLAAEGR
ncbi:MAG: MFS transporter [Rhodospirillaceae bacterium]